MNYRNDDKFAQVMLDHLAEALDLGAEPEMSVFLRYQIVRDCVHQLRLMELEDHFTTGPYAGLSMISKNLGEVSSADFEITLLKLSGLVKLARSIPVGCSLHIDVPECREFKAAMKVYADGREQGRD